MGPAKQSVRGCSVYIFSFAPFAYTLYDHFPQSATRDTKNLYILIFPARRFPRIYPERKPERGGGTRPGFSGPTKSDPKKLLIQALNVKTGHIIVTLFALE